MDLNKLLSFKDKENKYDKFIEVYNLGSRWLFATDGIRAVGMMSYDKTVLVDQKQSRVESLSKIIDKNTTIRLLNNQKFMCWLHSTSLCDECDSIGKVDCEDCTDGKTFCEHCNGGGYLEHECECSQYYCNCRRRRDCDCDDGYITCPSCDGSTSRPCPECLNSNEGKIFGSYFNLKLIKDLGMSFFEEVALDASGANNTPIIFRKDNLMAIVMPIHSSRSNKVYES